MQQVFSEALQTPGILSHNRSHSRRWSTQGERVRFSVECRAENMLNVWLKSAYCQCLCCICFFVYRMSTGGGCSYSSQGSSPSSPPLSSLNLNIKSERASPEHMLSPVTPSSHHSPKGRPEGLSRLPPGPYMDMDREENEMNLKQLEVCEGWQR